jgi:hypothetical protein
MQKHILIQRILYGPVGAMTRVDLSAYDTNGDGVIMLDEIECQQVLIGEVTACGAMHRIRIGFILLDVPEEYYGLDIFDETDPHELKWNWWPTNCYQGDTVRFDILFELLQTDYAPPGG